MVLAAVVVAMPLLGAVVLASVAAQRPQGVRVPAGAITKRDGAEVAFVFTGDDDKGTVEQRTLKRRSYCRRWSPGAWWLGRWRQRDRRSTGAASVLFYS